jgi:predicted transport protein
MTTYSSSLLYLNEQGKRLFSKLRDKILELEGVYPEIQEKSQQITFKLARKDRKKGSRFCCIHPASVPHCLKKSRDRETSMVMHLNNRTKQLIDKEDFILQYTKPNNKSGSYAEISVSSEKEIDIAMELIRQCYELLRRDLSG